MKLYEVKSVMPRYEKPSGRRFANVPLNWFRWHEEDVPAPARPYAELIKDFDPDHPDAELDTRYIDGLFSLEEAEQLADFLKVCPDCGGERDKDKVTVTEVVLPVKKGNYPYQWLPCRPSHNDFLCLFMAPDYSLPFKAAGYFDVERGLEVIHGRQDGEEHILQ